MNELNSEDLTGAQFQAECDKRDIDTLEDIKAVRHLLQRGFFDLLDDHQQETIIDMASEIARLEGEMGCYIRLQIITSKEINEQEDRDEVDKWKSINEGLSQ